MVPRGSGRRVALVIVVAGLVVAAATLLAYRTPPPSVGPASPATSSVTVDLPGPLNACSALSPDASPTTAAVLDLIRPSAFLTGPTDVLYGEGGAITSAELVSLHPETVVYSLDTRLRWSDGHRFSVGDLIQWWQAARHQPSVMSDGYRDISGMKVSRQGHEVTATFSRDFADWNLLFRDVNEAGSTAPCAISSLVDQPSLGPYRVVGATATRVVLDVNPEWTANYNRFHRVIIVTDPELSSHDGTYFVKYSPEATRQLVTNLVSHPRFEGNFGNASSLEEITFSPHNALTSSARVRSALSWLIDRRALLSGLFSSFTFTPSVPTSALFSQGQFDYPPHVKTPATAHLDLAHLDPTVDCHVCAVQVLRRAGYQRGLHGWRDVTGATLSVNLAVGPSDIDQRTARLITDRWNAQGIRVAEVHSATEGAAAALAASGWVDAALFERPTASTPWLTARSWTGTPFSDAFPSGITPAGIAPLLVVAQSSFNPATADETWLKIDQELLRQFWVRPLFTVPSLTEWTRTLANVTPALSEAGLVDQVSNWGIAPTSPTSTVLPVG